LKYLLRRLANRLTLGVWLGIRSLARSRVRDRIGDDFVEYFLGSDIGNRLYFYGDFEKKELEICKRFIGKDSTVIDIGANIGIHTIFFSKLATSGKVVSFEPQLTIFDTLLRNVRKLENVIPIDIAINSQSMLTEFFIAKDNAYSSLKDTKRKEILARKFVMTLPFDTMSGAFRKIDFIKIDVEGLEHEVIQSMPDTLRTHKPVLFVEIYAGKNSNPDPDKTVALLSEMGYSAFYVDDDGELARYTKHNDGYYNYFFVHSA